MAYVGQMKIKDNRNLQLPVNTKEKPYVCKVCSKTFRQKFALTRHLLVHSKKKLREKRSDSKNNPGVLRPIHTKEKSHGCKVCNKHFSNKSNLRQHLRVHTEEKVSCEVCNLLLSCKSSISRHLLVHTKEKLHTCEVCNKRFSLKGNLKAHLLLHTNEKPHSCELCHKQFTQKSHLKRHRLIHTGEKPHTCEVCQKQFAYRPHLRRHLIVHSEKKPSYNCEVSSFPIVTRHLLLHPEKPIYRCEICHRQFSQEIYFNKHRAFHTTKKPLIVKLSGFV